MKSSIIIFCALLALATSYQSHQAPSGSDDQFPIVTTSLGDVMGTTTRSRLDRPIYAFRGIRFAKPPVGELRFQPPQPIEKWTGVYNATNDGASCPQSAWIEAPQSEDCLFVNVFSPKLPRGHVNPKKPVLVFFHAGGFYFMSGASFLEGPEYLLDQDIVLVVSNYRLSSLGFLSTGTKEAPGNNGLKDQVVLLKWVRDNIAAFGGDPNSVTISGYSAGGISVNGHMVSPMSKGLFHRAIIMSGSFYAPWPVPDEQLDLAKLQARLVNCPDGDVGEMMKCLKTVPAEAFGNTFPQLAEFGFEPILQWRPVIERNFGQERFLTEHPVDSVLKGKFQNVPVVIGLTGEELGSIAFYIINNETLRTQLDEDFDRIAPIILLYERDTERSRIISRDLRKAYFGDGKIDLDGLTKLLADGIVGYAMDKAAKGLSAKNSQPVYFYCFNYTGRYSNFYLPGTNNTVPFGAVHHDDLIYLFRSVLFPYFNQTDPEYAVMRKMTTMWANFVKTGKPIPVPNHQLDDVNWQPFTQAHQRYLNIESKLSIRENLLEERYRVWEKLFPLPSHYAQTKG